VRALTRLSRYVALEGGLIDFCAPLWTQRGTDKFRSRRGNIPPPSSKSLSPASAGAFLLAASVGSIRVSALVRFPTDSRGTLRYTFLPSPTAALRQAPVAERPVALPPEIGERPMPITEFLDGYNPDPETKRVMGIAFEMTRKLPDYSPGHRA